MSSYDFMSVYCRPAEMAASSPVTETETPAPSTKPATKPAPTPAVAAPNATSILTTSKLNPDAKEFSLNPEAKEFTPVSVTRFHPCKCYQISPL